MLKIHQVFILKFILLLAGTLLVSLLISYVTLKTIIVEHNQKHLQDTIMMLELDIENLDDLDLHAKKIAKATGLRVTVIDDDGVVLAESDKQKEEMENHGSRYEVIGANKEEFASIVRYSQSVKTDFLYVAKKSIYRGAPIYLRMSISLERVMGNFYSLWTKLALVFGLVIIFAYYISKKMSERIVYDIRQLTKYLDEISNKNYKAVVKTKYFHEFLYISLMLKNLVKKLANRDKQKRKYTAKLRLMNKQRNDILSAISHEFKNPVASIIGYAQTLHEDLDMDVKIREKFLGKIESNGAKISMMLDRLALSVKLENNDLEIKAVRFDIKTLVDEVAANLASKYRDRKIKVEMEPCIVKADKNMMEIVLNNLIDNALKYSESDVIVRLSEERIEVCDKGIGIKAEHLEKVTSKFYRIHKNSWDNSMGLGLAMVSYILKAHKSSLSIKSEYAKGSVFSFSLENMTKK